MRASHGVIGLCGSIDKGVEVSDFRERLGVVSEDVNPTYASQPCSSCGFVSKSNRANQSSCVCGWCGHSDNADVNGARNLLARSAEAYGRRS